jgi:hypothetical protein
MSLIFSTLPTPVTSAGAVFIVSASPCFLEGVFLLFFFALNAGLLSLIALRHHITLPPDESLIIRYNMKTI